MAAPMKSPRKGLHEFLKTSPLGLNVHHGRQVDVAQAVATCQIAMSNSHKLFG